MKLIRPRYRKWTEMDGRQHYLMIHPKGLCVEITIETNSFYGDKVTIFQTSRQNPLNADVVERYKQICFKSEWQHIQRIATQYLRGDMINLALIKEKKHEKSILVDTAAV